MHKRKIKIFHLISKLITTNILVNVVLNLLASLVAHIRLVFFKIHLALKRLHYKNYRHHLSDKKNMCLPPDKYIGANNQIVFVQCLKQYAHKVSRNLSTCSTTVCHSYLP